jgi:hypothetical protein
MSHRYNIKNLLRIHLLLNMSHRYSIKEPFLLLPHTVMLFCILTHKPYCCTLFYLIVSEVVILSSRCAMIVSMCTWSVIQGVSCAKRCAMNSTIIG